MARGGGSKGSDKGLAKNPWKSVSPMSRITTKNTTPNKASKKEKGKAK